MLIEQAVFTSADTDRTQGYQLVGRSAGLTEPDAHELALWGPSHDSLLERSGDPTSTNFHQLASGSYCVSRTTLAGAEFSGRGGARVYTHFLIVPPGVLARFGNNPFAILRAAMATGALGPRDEFAGELPQLRLAGRAPAVDLAMLARLACDPGPTAMATLVQSVLSADRVALASRLPTEQLLAGLFSVLPVECRTELSFSTGLKLSPTRNVRLLALSEAKVHWKTVARCGVTLLDIDAPGSAESVHWDGWAGLVAEVLTSGKLSVFAAELQNPRPGLTCAGIDELCATLRSKLREGAKVQVREPVTVAAADAPPSAPHHAASSEPPKRPAGRAHHDPAVVAARDAARTAVADLAESLAHQPPEVLELLEQIDDVVFAAISGDARALAELEMLWPVASEQLDERLFEQSREQYLRCALSICNECVEGDIKRPERALAAVDVLCVLFQE